MLLKTLLILFLIVSFFFPLAQPLHAQGITPTIFCVGGIGAPPCAPINPSPTIPPTSAVTKAATIIVSPSGSASALPLSNTPTLDPCAEQQNSISHDKGKKKFKSGHKNGGFIEQFMKFLFWLIEYILKGGTFPPPNTSPSPAPEPTSALEPTETPNPCTEPPGGRKPTETANPTANPTAVPSNTMMPSVTNPAPISLLPENEDHRAYIHGLDWVKVGGRDLIVYSSNNYPPTEPGDEWIHNIYYSWVTQANPAGTFAPQTLVNASMAQEPASAAVNNAGLLAVTSEDAQFNENLDQTFGIWNSTLTAQVPYGQKLMPPQGGHSGHIAASGDKYLVSFSDGWVDGGGVDNLGTGDDVFGKIINADGTTGAMINTAVGTATRDWWPIVAGSDINWLQVWQRYGTAGTGGGTVMGAIINQSGAIVKQLTIYTNNKYYYHDVQYIPSLGMYLVVGSQNIGTNGGVAVLVDKNGTVVTTKTGLPNTVREAQTVINDAGTIAVYPTEHTGAVVLSITPTAITVKSSPIVNWNWDYMGTDGMFTAPNRVVFATGTQQGVKFVTVDF